MAWHGMASLPCTGSPPKFLLVVWFVFHPSRSAKWLTNDCINAHSQETDGQSQRGAAGRRQRYFLAKQVRREHDGGVARTRYRLIAKVWAAETPKLVAERVEYTTAYCGSVARSASAVQVALHQNCKDLCRLLCVRFQDASSAKVSGLALPPPAKLPLQPDSSFALRRMPANMSEEEIQEQRRRRQQLQQRRQQQGQQQGQQAQQQGGATSPGAEDLAPEGEIEVLYLMRRAKEFNVATRERPEDLQLWLDFAAFQDEALARSESLSLLKGWSMSLQGCMTLHLSASNGNALRDRHQQMIASGSTALPALVHGVIASTQSKLVL